jgi:LacI family transcriptional regulator
VNRVSIKDIAAQTGVSFQTVSKVLTGKGAISEATRERVQEAATALGYVPNALARSLVQGATRTLGVLASDLSDTVLAQFLVGAEREARRQAHSVVIATVAPDGADGEHALQALLERRVDGILLAAPQLEHDERLGQLLRRRVHAVSVHHVLGGDISTVGSDQVLVGRLATDHLVQLGCRRIGTIGGAVERRVTRSRLYGYHAGLHAAGLPFRSDLVEHGSWEVEGGYQATLRLLAREPGIDGLVVQNDSMALGALSALHDLGKRVPDDCAVVGCDDLPLAARTIPPLTTIHIPFYETGKTAMRLLLQEIEHPEAAPQQLLLPIQLICRASTMAPVS